VVVFKYGRFIINVGGGFIINVGGGIWGCSFR